MKKVIYLFVLCMVLGLAGCGQSQENKESSTESTSVQVENKNVSDIVSNEHLTNFLCPAGGSFIDRVIVDGMHLLHASGHAGPKSYRSSWEGPALAFFGAGGAS